MREIHSQLILKAAGDHAAYTLTAEDALSNHASLYDYLCFAASRPMPRHIRPQLSSSHSSPDSLCAKLLQLSADQSAPNPVKKYQKLFTGGIIKDWPLTAVEGLPGAWRLYLVNHTAYRHYQAALKKLRQTNPDYQRKTDQEIAAIEQLTPFYEMLVCSAMNDELSGENIITVNFDVPRYQSAGTDVYTLGFSADCITIGEPAGLGQRYLKIMNDANPREYIAEIIEIQ